MIGTFLSVVAATSIIGAIEDITPHPFYDPPANIAEYKPGAIVRTEPMAGAPAGSAAVRVLYRSTGVKGEPIAVSGIVIVPDGPPPAGGRHVVAWAHPTTGVARKCAPSFMPDPFSRIPGLTAMLQQGWVVTATDYQGLGTPGPHPYLVGESEARSVLDSVRAARELPGSNAGNRLVVWGHSQGGHASLFTAQLAHGYASELRLEGAAAAAPATELGELLQDDGASIAGSVFTAYSLWSWSSVYGYNGGLIIKPPAFPPVEELAGRCIETGGEVYSTVQIESQIKNGILSVDIDKTPPWDRLIAMNTPDPAALKVPVLVTQGLKDDIVEPNVTIEFVNQICAAGGTVQILELPDVGHAQTGARSAPQAVEWMAARFAGQPAPRSCR